MLATVLPLPFSSFIGRQRELADVKCLMTTARLVTLTGAGGCGKTRLALQAAAELCKGDSESRPYADGVWFVELAPLSDPSLVLQRVAATLDVREQPGQPLLTTLINYLREKEALLLLDNCEHLIEACAQLAESLLSACAQLHILAASRAPLRIAGEQVYPVPPLAVPNLDEPDTQLLENESVRLFVERAQAAAGSLTPVAQNARVLRLSAQICRRLDGMPLAIELAAARTQLLTPTEILERLDDVFHLLSRGRAVGAPHHQTLRAVMDWSWRLLSEPARVLFRRLAVFAGGWTLEAAEAVCTDESMAASDVLDVLTALADQSLVVVKGDAAHERMRYSFLEPIRQYAREKLQQAGELSQVQDRQLNYFLSLVERVEPELVGAEEVWWLPVLHSEYDNIRAALEWSCQSHKAELGLRLAAALWWFWVHRSDLLEGQERLLALLEQPEAQAPTAARVKGLCVAGHLTLLLLDVPRAQALLREAVGLARALGQRRLLALALNRLGLATLAQDPTAARLLIEESLTLARELEDQWLCAFSLNLLGQVFHRQGDYLTARAHFEESLQLYRAIGSKNFSKEPLSFLGVLLYQQGEYETAAALLEAAVSLAREQNDRADTALRLITLGHVARLQKNYGSAQAIYHEALSLLDDIKVRWLMALSLEAVACLGASMERAEQAARLLGAAETLFESVGYHFALVSRADYERNLVTARRQLGPAAFQAAWVAGQQLHLAQAMAEAKQLTNAQPSGQPASAQSAQFPAGLSEREVEVLRWVARGLSNQEIADQLVLSKRTVEAHMRSIFSKLNVTTRSAAAHVAVRYGLT